MNKKTIVITGASSGMGKASAIKFAEEGWNVAATMRNPQNVTGLDDLDNIKLYALDVTDEKNIEEVKDQIINDFGKVDVVFNNAGYAIAGSFESADKAAIKTQFDTNLFGLLDVTRAFLPHFRENKDGLFVNTSSIGGFCGFPFVSLYNSTKWAVEGFTEAVSHELRPLGIKVKLIQPGIILTDFFERSMTITSKEGLEDYNPALQKAFFGDDPADRQGSTPEYAANLIYEAITDESGTMRYLIGPDADQTKQMRDQAGPDQFIEGLYQSQIGL
ncbi:SDR family oxidoreductase [Acidaminobacter sp. JC074]|uniref:SDR family oxidoreductase n=1 Tax=Acidaminobacter sp. JC074 TaxID=2530199 RepID=UPI001F111B78|nr:SDR family oxidoreductase [Acidaminobacter sp. JC074]MCH4887580.1 SDR family oxidoreductase [Acidaminobacter sp. JC074]